MFSPFWRLIYDKRPGHNIVLQDREIALGPDRIVLLPDHYRCHFREDQPAPTFWLHFSHSRRPLPSQTLPIELPPSRLELDLIENLTPLFNTKLAEVQRQRIFRLSLALLQVVLARPEIEWMEERSEPMLKVVRYIEEHFAEPLYNRRLARIAGLCATNFAEAFRQCQGVTPAQFVTQVRVYEASHLLTNTALSVDEIAAKTGFPNRAYFSRVFTKVTGEAPAGFRQNHGTPSTLGQPAIQPL
ncbi:MAG: AraC family transcriptional regulator [Verrucomicrobiota bacterium]